MRGRRGDMNQAHCRVLLLMTDPSLNTQTFMVYMVLDRAT
jgi:hypothetical protein